MITGQTIGRERAFTKSLRTKAENKPSFGKNMGKIMLKINKCRLNNDIGPFKLTKMLEMLGNARIAKKNARKC